MSSKGWRKHYDLRFYYNINDEILELMEWNFGNETATLLHGSYSSTGNRFHRPCNEEADTLLVYRERFQQQAGSCLLSRFSRSLLPHLERHGCSFLKGPESQKKVLSCVCSTYGPKICFASTAASELSGQWVVPIKLQRRSSTILEDVLLPHAQRPPYALSKKATRVTKSRLLVWRSTRLRQASSRLPSYFHMACWKPFGTESHAQCCGCLWCEGFPSTSATQPPDRTQLPPERHQNLWALPAHQWQAQHSRCAKLGKTSKPRPIRKQP